MLKFFGFVCASFIWLTSFANAFETTATAAFVVDQTTGAVLLEKNADTALPPASMSKLMTLYMLFEALKQGRVEMSTMFGVSQKAHEMGGSTMFLRYKERVSVENLIQGIIVQSGNDACVVVAEGLTQADLGQGSEAEFARRMTVRAKELGLTNSTFANATGWPHPGQKMSARDLVFLADRLLNDFPEYYHYFSQPSFTWDKIVQKNRNPLLSLGIGADGLKTGHTDEAGYGLVGSAQQGGRRIIFMVTGLRSKGERSSEAERVANWALRQFTLKDLVQKNTRVADVPVWMGSESTVSVMSKSPIKALIPYNSKDQISATLVYNGPVPAPIKAGDQLAELVVAIPGLDPIKHPLFAEHDVPLGGITTRIKSSAIKVTNRIMGDMNPVTQ